MDRVKSENWRKLDNAAKLFSAASNSKDTRVFRFYCELKEEVIEEKLQLALEKTVKVYPAFLSVMRKGLFWHYLEQSTQKPVVRKEYREPCSNLYVRDKKELLFEVTYYGRRINFEVFHALTDGTGASEFIKELVKNYLLEVHGEELQNHSIVEEENPYLAGIEDDGFTKYYSKDKKAKKIKKKEAYQIRKYRSEMGSLQITEAEISVGSLKSRVKEYGVSMTVYLTAVFLCAIHEKMTRRQEEDPVILMVPVNLRKFFPTNSMLNFFSWIEAGHQFGQGRDDIESVIADVKEYFEKELTKEKMADKINEYVSLEVNPILRLAPLELKNLCISAGTRASAKDVTAIFSNMGIIKMPDVLNQYIDRFGVYTSTPKLELCMCSFRDKISLGFTSRYDSDRIRNAFFRILKEDGIDVKILKPEYPKCTVTDSMAEKVFRLISFLAIVIAVSALCADYGFDRTFNYSLFISAGVFTMWFALMIAFFKRHNLMKNAMWQLIVISVGCILWDLSMGWHGWSVNYIIPEASVMILVIMMLLRFLYYRMPKDYMIYFVMAAIFGLALPIIFNISGLLYAVIPSVVSVGVSIIILAWLTVFKGRELNQELKKKFHL